MRKYLLPCLFLALLILQLFVPPVIGLADNGDYAKVTGGLCLIPAEFPQFTSDYNYFISDWQRDEGRCSPNLLVTSEKALAFAAWRLSQWLIPGNFDIRWLGALHLLTYAAGFIAFIRSFDHASAAVRWAAGMFALLAMTDLSYTAYLPTFYTDAVAVCAFFALCGLTLLMTVTKEVSATKICVAGVAAALYVTSKPSHAFAGIPVAAFFMIQSLRLPRREKVVGLCWAAGLLVTTFAMHRKTPELYTVDPFFSIVFYEIVGHSSAPEKDLAALGLGPEHAAAKGMYTFQDQWPANDIAWKLNAYRQARGYSGLGRYYLTHPLRAFAIMIDAMRESCRDIRPLLLANFRRQDGYAPGSQSRVFGVWSALKRSVYVNYSPYLLVLYLSALVSGIVLWRRSGAAGVWILMVCVIGFGELLISTLGDACETSRHLLLFHAATDVLIGVLVVCIVEATARLVGKAFSNPTRVLLSSVL